jgi:hypothetical protein
MKGGKNVYVNLISCAYRLVLAKQQVFDLFFPDGARLVTTFKVFFFQSVRVAGLHEHPARMIMFVIQDPAGVCRLRPEQRKHAQGFSLSDSSRLRAPYGSKVRSYIITSTKNFSDRARRSFKKKNIKPVR